MMKTVTLFLLLACLTQQTAAAADNVDAADGPPQPSFPWLHRPWFPHRPFFPMPPLPSHQLPKPKPDPGVQKCFTAKFEERKCVGEIKASYWNKKISVGDDCCKIVRQVSSDACAKTAFKGFDNPYFGSVLKQYCAKKA